MSMLNVCVLDNGVVETACTDWDTMGVFIEKRRALPGDLDRLLGMVRDCYEV